MKRRACVCGVVGCKRHRVRTRRRGLNPYHAAGYKQKAARTVKAWKAAVGNRCPGYRVPSHTAYDLTADHVVPISMGGEMLGELSVLCNRCNARRGGRNRVKRTA